MSLSEVSTEGSAARRPGQGLSRRVHPSASSSSSPAAPSATTGGPVALSRALRDPRLARRRGALQADRDRRRLGGRPAVPDHGDLHDRVRPARRICRATAPRPIRSWSSPACCRGSCSPSILSEASNSLVGNANLIGKVYFPRIIIPASSAVVALVDFAHQPRDARRADGVVRLRAELADLLLLPVFVVLAVLASLGPALLHHRAQREVPRLPLHHPVHRAVRALRLAGRLLERRRAGAVALLVQPQSGGRRDRRLPLVHPRRRESHSTAGLSAEPRRRRACSCGSASPISAAPSAASRI